MKNKYTLAVGVSMAVAVGMNCAVVGNSGSNSVTVVTVSARSMWRF